MVSPIFQGRTFQSQIEFSMARNTHLNKVLLEKYTSSKVRKIYENVLRNVEKTYPQYIDELRGIAAGSKISFFKVLNYKEDMKICVYFRCSTLVISAAYWWNCLVYQWKRTSWWTFRLDFHNMRPRTQGKYYILHIFFIIINDRQHFNFLHFSFHCIQKEIEFQNASPITFAFMFAKII